MTTNHFINQLGVATDSTSRQSRFDSLSILSRQSVLAILIVCLTMLGAGNAWADSSYTLGWGSATGASGTYTNFTANSGSVTGICSFSTDKNDAYTTPAYNSGGSELRLYNNLSGTPNYTTNGGQITITPASGITITGFTITATASYQPTTKYKIGSGSLTTLPAWSSNTTSASGLSVGSSSSITIQNCNSSSLQLRIKKIVITYTTAVSTPYTVTFYKTDGTSSDLTEASAGAGVTPPTMKATCGDWSFQGWSKSESDDDESTTELSTVTLTTGKYYPTANTTLYPVYTDTTGSSGPIAFTPGTDTGTSSVTKTSVTCAMSAMDNASYYQIYASNSGTFSNASGKITKIEFTCTASGTDKYGPGNVSANVGSYSYSGTKGTWTGSAASVTLSASKQVRMSSLTVTYSNLTVYYYSYPSCCEDLASIKGSFF